MWLTAIAALIMCISFLGFVPAVAYFLGHVGKLFGFDEDTKETCATVVGFRTSGSGTVDDPSASDPIIEYYNEYKGQIVRKEMFNSGLLAKSDALFRREQQRIVHVGDQVKIQYTYKKARVVDSRFTSSKSFQIRWYILPLIICLGVGFVGFVLFIISFLL